EEEGDAVADERGTTRDREASLIQNINAGVESDNRAGVKLHASAIDARAQGDRLLCCEVFLIAAREDWHGDVGVRIGNRTDASPVALYGGDVGGARLSANHAHRDCGKCARAVEV